jgi:hypothetical protein
MELYEKILEGIIPEVSFGYRTVHVFRPSELKSGQLGYSVGPNGESLTGNMKGDWLPHWIVIGREDLCGDPLFIDSSSERFPVFTAMHGKGEWDAKQIADSLQGFWRALLVVAALSKNRENPTSLEKNPLTQFEKDAALTAIGRENAGGDIEFWEIWLSLTNSLL